MSEPNTAPAASSLTNQQVESLIFLFKNAGPAEKKALLSLFVAEDTVKAAALDIDDNEKIYLAVLTDGDTKLLGLVTDQAAAEATVLAEIGPDLGGRPQKPATKPVRKAPRKPTDRRPSKKK